MHSQLVLDCGHGRGRGNTASWSEGAGAGQREVGCCNGDGGGGGGEAALSQQGRCAEIRTLEMSHTQQAGRSGSNKEGDGYIVSLRGLGASGRSGVIGETAMVHVGVWGAAP
jgi:hypothetical protein